MKLALIADTFPPLQTSGAVQLRDLSREFVRQGHGLTVLLPEPNLDRPWTMEKYHGAQVLRLKAPRTKNINYARRTIGEWLMPHAMRRNLRKSPLAEHRWEGLVWYSPSIFHAPLVHTLKRKSGCKGYLIIRDIFPEWAVDLDLMRPGLVYRFFKRIALQQYNAADIIGVQTPGNLGYFDAWRQAERGRSLEVLQNWLDVPASAHCKIRIQETAIAGRKIFVYAGNMGIAQGMNILLDLAARVQSRRDIGFLFVGRGSEAGRLKARAEALRMDNIVFHDEIDPDEIASLYAQCSAGIVALDPRHKSHNIPGKFLTYMQNRLPVLANVNLGNDLANLIRSECVGQVCETNQLDELEELLDALVRQIETDLDLFDRCSRLFLRTFSVDQAVRQIVAALNAS
jgi:glycosyltransferase involved in cell wall biosynthesis